MTKKTTKLAAMVALLAATSCGAGTPGLQSQPKFSGEEKILKEETYRDLDYKIEKGKVAKEFKGQSNYTVLVIPEFENSYGCIANIYLKLKSIVDHTKFVAREERCGPAEHTKPGFEKFRFWDSDLNVHTYAEITEKKRKEREDMVRNWVFNRQYPSQFARNPDYQNKESTIPVMAEVLNESVEQNKVITIGVDYFFRDNLKEDKGLAAFIAEREKTDPDPDNNSFTFQKNWIAVNAMDYYASTIKKGSLVPFVIGYNRSKDITKRLKKSEISFQVFEFEQCTKYYKDKGMYKAGVNQTKSDRFLEQSKR